MIPELSKEEIHELPIEELSSRMDAILETNIFERYGLQVYKSKLAVANIPSVRKIINTAHVQKMTLEQQKCLCHLIFNTLLQMEFSNVAAAASNSIVFSPEYSEDSSWKQVKTHINNAALTQFGIISSRIVMECFMELLHYLGEGERIRAKKSTFNSFKKWLNNPANPFSYFATHILRAYIFDRNLRTPEVHASSKLSSLVLRMEKPSHEDRNDHLELTNIMLNVWRPLEEILNNGTAYSMYGTKEDFEWLDSYLKDDNEEKALHLRAIFDQM